MTEKWENEFSMGPTTSKTTSRYEIYWHFARESPRAHPIQENIAQQANLVQNEMF